MTHFFAFFNFHFGKCNFFENIHFFRKFNFKKFILKTLCFFILWCSRNVLRNFKWHLFRRSFWYLTFGLFFQDNLLIEIEEGFIRIMNPKLEKVKFTILINYFGVISGHSCRLSLFVCKGVIIGIHNLWVIPWLIVHYCETDFYFLTTRR